MKDFIMCEDPMTLVNDLAPCVPTYLDFLETVSNIEQSLYQFQSEVKLCIRNHTYPYVVEIIHFDKHFLIYIFSQQGLQQLQNRFDTLMLQPF